MPPITRLPEDILAEIFQQFVHLHDIRWMPTAPIDDRPHGWIILGHVCRAWRHILNDRPVLWTRIILSDHHPDRVRAFLQRSRRCPIEIEGENATIATQAKWAAKLWRECSRWVRAEVAITRKVVQECRSPLEMPLLEDLYVTMDYTADFGALSLSALPRLKRLEAQSCLWKALRGWLRPTLTHLLVTDLARGGLPSDTDWLYALKGLPLLQGLHLMNGTIAPQSDVSLSDPSGMLVHLPCLRTFRVAQFIFAVSAATALLNQISVHPACCIWLEVTPFPYNVPLVTLKCIIDALADKMSTSRSSFSAFYVGVELIEDGRHWLDFNFGDRAQVDVSQETNTVQNQFRLSVDLSCDNELYVANLIGYIWTTSLVASVSSLTVEDLAPYSMLSVAAADLRMAPGLEELHIACRATLSLLADLLEHHLNTPGDEDPFPRLRMLTINEDKVQPPSHWERAPLDRTLSALTRRKALGLGPDWVLI